MHSGTQIVRRCKIHSDPLMALAFDLLYLHLKSDAITEISNWIKRMRSDPAFLNLGYKVVSFIENGDGKTTSGKLLRLASVFEHLGNVLIAKTKWHPRPSARLE